MTLVLKDATQKKKTLLEQSEIDRKKKIDEGELRLLQEAHDAIQESLSHMGRVSNEEVSRTILESKQALFTRRDEIVDSVFAHVSERLNQFKKSSDYQTYLQSCINNGFSQLGKGKITVEADAEDLPLLREIDNGNGLFMVKEAADYLHGGCLFINHSVGRMCDFSIKKQLEDEKRSFLERYNLRLDG